MRKLHRIAVWCVYVVRISVYVKYIFHRHHIQFAHSLHKYKLDYFGVFVRFKISWRKQILVFFLWLYIVFGIQRFLVNFKKKKRKEKKRKKNSVRFFDWTTQILRTAEQLNDGKRKIIINFLLLYSGSLSPLLSLYLSFLLLFNRCHRHRSRPYFLRVCALFLSFHFASCAVPCRVCVCEYLSIFILKLSHICMYVLYTYI